MSNVQRDVARPLLRQLSGFRGYPKAIRLAEGGLDTQGEDRFVDCLCEISLSVEHALAIVESFDGEFPTIRELRDTALNLRPKFEAKIDQRKQWEAEYGKPDPGFSARILDTAMGSTAIDPAIRKRLHAEESRAMLWQAIRDSLYYTEGPGRRVDQFWAEAAAKHGRNHPQEVAAFRVQLRESGWDVLMAVDWQKPRPPVHSLKPAPVLIPDKAITQADIDEELRKAGRQPGDGENDTCRTAQ